MAGNQTESSRVEQMSVNKVLVAKKYKQCEIYRRMCDLYEEACFSKKNVYKKAKHWFASMSLSQKDIL